MASLASMLRRVVRVVASPVMDKILYSDDPRVRHLAFEMRSRREALMIADGKEKYVIRGGDEWIGRWLFVSGEYDFDKLGYAVELLRTQGRAPTTLIDVGANIGSICIPAVARGLFERAVAIEPDPDNVRLLRANIVLNDLQDRIEVIASAAGGRDGEELTLALSSDNFGDHRVLSGDLSGDGRQTVKIPSATLDTLCASIDPADALIWMDIQGYEGFALAGAKRFRAARTPLCIEMEPRLLSRNDGFEPLFAAASDYGHFIDLREKGAPRPMLELRAQYDALPSAGTDLLLVD